MNLYDIIILIVALLGLIDGLRKGLIQTIGAIAGVICGIFAAKALSYLLTPYISQLFESANPKVLQVVSFIVLFVLTVILFHFVALLLSKLVKMVMLGWLNRIAGGLFAVVLYLFVLSIVANVFDYFNKGESSFHREKSSTSRFYGPLSDLAPKVLPFIHFEDWNIKIPEALQQSAPDSQDI
jgi:membrane protein required for colicin V production